MRKGEENRGFSVREAIKKDWPLWLLLGGLIIGSLLVYPHLPEEIPRHWNFKGEVDAYWAKPYGVFVPLLIMAGVYLLMLFLPYLDPKRENYQRFAGAYTFIRQLLVIFLGLIYVISILAGMGYNLNVGFLVKAMVAVLFILIGNFMGQLRHNYFVGIRTPWTLASEEVWQKTHRLGARVWVLGGIVCLLASFMDSVWGTGLFFASLMVMVLVPVVYSYTIYEKLQD